MADNVAITAGSGTTIRTDDVSGVQYQVVKLDGGGDGASVPVVAGQQLKAASLPVTVASDQEIADDAADSGNPAKVGGRARAFDGTDPGSVAENDRADLITDLNRRVYVNPVHPMFWSAVENNSTAQTNNAIKAAPGAGLSLYITDIIISTDAAMNAKLVEDTGGTPVTKAGPFYFAANGGAGLHFVTPIKCTADKDLGYTTSAAGNCTIEVHGFTAP